MSAGAESGFDADVAVVGLGAIGSSTAWRLAARGASVLGIDQHEPGHPWGGSHGRTRLFRVACLEHPGLTPIARRARELWRELEAASGESLLLETGAVMIGRPGSRIIEGTLAAAAAHALPVEELSADAIADRMPGHARLDPGDVGLWDPEAGVLRPEAAIVAAVDAARAAGARIRTGERVLAIEADAEGVTVRLAHDEVRARRVVVSAGPWLPQLVPGLPITPHRVVMTWFRARDGHDASVERLPVFIRSVPGTGADEPTWIWGHGALPGDLAKVGPEFDGPFDADDPDAIDREIHPGETEGISASVAAALADLDPVPAELTTCIMAHTPDGQFVVGRAPAVGREASGTAASDRLVVAGGCSGHSFKHASALGELAAQLAVDEAPFTDIGFLDPARFA
ncbi:N-methyl-L-tryptophan oxidase [Agrococcus sp. 1P02AA]|uniref:N-methyl-L-tryptophan oxidase n=1 Tax=Agrococcus sp. 1P02AA TaxID=3132259 RepID=UPI0039A41FBB